MAIYAKPLSKRMTAVFGEVDQMLQQTRFIQKIASLTDQFDNPFVDDTFMRASEGFFTASALDCVQSGGYRLPFEHVRNASSLGVPIVRFLAHGSSPIGGAFFNPDGVHVREEAAFHAALDQLTAEARADVLLWPFFPLEAREYGWLEKWLVTRLGRSDASDVIPMARRHKRAYLNCASDNVAAEDGGMSLSRNKRKTTGRQWRRLSDLGKLEVLSTQDGLDYGEAIESFLHVEASGWKASKGTALAVDERLNAFVHKVFSEMMAKDRARIDLLSLDGRCIGGLVSFRVGRGLFTWKTGMDDVYKRYSPGVQILLEASRQAIADPGIDYIDSLADSGHPIAEHIWAGRRSMALLFVPLNRRGTLAARGLRTAYVARDSARYWAKRALGRV
ncbi:Acetyltransferase (GNAT) domain-containing protein [Cohaesibacter marisflavi]|uniref:Acetyltransferase (GNAT) domain-containing protein n=2 Tax=Cohaesibacter marisflavi TaxID=655353 RepID=A0A1I5IK14_9HYPH|nr:Acetyltransferase (GNAT) domain-containing protein [Cohaesibacter marisflavi]